VDEERCVFTPGLYHNAGKEVKIKPGKTAIAFLCNRPGADHTKNQANCKLVPTNDRQYMCVVITNMDSAMTIRIDPFCPLDRVIGMSSVSWYILSMDKEDFFITCPKCEGLLNPEQ
jgi:hypothetical protein